MGGNTLSTKSHSRVLNSRKSGMLHPNSHPGQSRYCSHQCHRDTYRHYLVAEMRKLCSFAQQSRAATHLEGSDRWQRKLLQNVLFFAMPDTSDLLHFCLTVQAGIYVLHDEPLHRMKNARFEMAVGRFSDV